MPRYEYKVVPAPTKGLKAKGLRSAEARFAHAVQELMNGLSGYGWEYQRAETLPSIERAGLTGTTTEWRNMLVFRRLREDDADQFQPELLPAPEAAIVEEPQVVQEETPDADGSEPLTPEPKAPNEPEVPETAGADTPDAGAGEPTLRTAVEVGETLKKSDT